MNFFLTSETTSDVTHAELQVLIDFEDGLNRAASDLQIAGVDQVAIVAVVMNPEIVPPFPAGVVFRRARKELDIKPAVAFAEWKGADRNGRISLLIEATVAILESRPRTGISLRDISALTQALETGRHTL